MRGDQQELLTGRRMGPFQNLVDDDAELHQQVVDVAERGVELSQTPSVVFDPFQEAAQGTCAGGGYGGDGEECTGTRCAVVAVAEDGPEAPLDASSEGREGVSQEANVATGGDGEWRCHGLE